MGAAALDSQTGGTVMGPGVRAESWPQPPCRHLGCHGHPTSAEAHPPSNTAVQLRPTTNLQAAYIPPPASASSLPACSSPTCSLSFSSSSPNSSFSQKSVWAALQGDIAQASVPAPSSELFQLGLLKQESAPAVSAAKVPCAEEFLFPACL